MAEQQEQQQPAAVPVAQQTAQQTALTGFLEAAAVLLHRGSPVTNGGVCCYCHVHLIHVHSRKPTGKGHAANCPWFTMVARFGELQNEIRKFNAGMKN